MKWIIKDARKEIRIKELEHQLKELYDSKGELDKLNCKIMRIPNVLKELKNG